MYRSPQTEVSNPLIPLQKKRVLLRQFLQAHHYHIPIHGFVVFVHPEFTLYQAPLDKLLIFPTQINRYIKRINQNSAKLSKQHDQISELLQSKHIKTSPITNIPNYDFAQFNKGIPCITCDLLSLRVQGYKCICQKCGTMESIENAVMRSVAEFRLLFPSGKITTKTIHEWCGMIPSKKKNSKIASKTLYQRR